jgi:hypothetical protein
MQEIFSSFMNNTKWHKLIEVLTDELNVIYVNYKLINSDCIRYTTFDSADFKPFFIEPILYKEIEWIEFPKNYKLTYNKRVTRKFDKIHTQDIDTIKRIINDLGEFMIDSDDNKLRLIAYR